MRTGMFDARTAERDCTLIAELRNELASEILYRSSTLRQRTVIADAFVDNAIDRLIAARAGNCLPEFISWMRDLAANRNGPFPGHAVIADACAVLEATLSREGICGADLRAALRRAADEAGRYAREEAAAEPGGAIDEVDARINDLVTQLETADLLTAEHSRAVASWCARIGRRLRFPDADVTNLTRSGLLHDIGKLRVPKDVLNAPRALSTNEWKLIRAHCVAGEAIAKKDPLLYEMLPGIRSHHERFGGGGYPDDLRAERIPLVARVVSVADCFNAMIGRRPYRPPHTPSFAIEELRRNRGTQFDPDVVDAMEDVVIHGR